MVENVINMHNYYENQCSHFPYLLNGKGGNSDKNPCSLNMQFSPLSHNFSNSKVRNASGTHFIIVYSPF